VVHEENLVRVVREENLVRVVREENLVRVVHAEIEDRVVHVGISGIVVHEDLDSEELGNEAGMMVDTVLDNLAKKQILQYSRHHNNGHKIDNKKVVVGNSKWPRRKRLQLNKIHL
jgi:hypothetical protein